MRYMLPSYPTSTAVLVAFSVHMELCGTHHRSGLVGFRDLLSVASGTLEGLGLKRKGWHDSRTGSATSVIILVFKRICVPVDADRS